MPEKSSSSVPIATPFAASTVVSAAVLIDDHQSQHDNVIGTSEPIPVSIRSDSNKLMRELNFNKNLVKILLNAISTCDLRYYIVDNSGSMDAIDGKIGSKVVSRYDELCHMLKWHGKLASLTGISSKFIMLNNPGHGLPSEIIVNDESSFAILKKMLLSDTRGSTPLCATIRYIIANITLIAPSLEASGKKAVVIIATDGESSDGDIAIAMFPLTRLPVKVIIRLCTNNERIIQYWNKIEEDLELELDVLDDLNGEATEIHILNPWLNYNEKIHRLREFGNLPNEFDYIDERELSLTQIRNIASYILDIQIEDLPDPNTDLLAFETEVQQQQANVESEFDIYSQTIKPWFNFEENNTNYIITTIIMVFVAIMIMLFFK